MEKNFKKIFLYNQIELIGYKTELTKSNNLNFQIISKHWKYFNQVLYQIKGHSSSSVNWVKYGVAYKENGKYYYLASIPYKLKCCYPLNMTRINIPNGYYALFNHKGKMIDISKTLSCIFKLEIPANNLIIKNIGIFGIIYFEKYDKKFHWNREDSIIEIFVPITKF